MQPDPGGRQDSGETLLLAISYAAALVVVAIEVLGAMTALTRLSLLGVALVAAVVLIRSLPPLAPVVGGLRELSRPEILMVGAVAAVLAVSLLIALVAPPNTWDSMTYHLARVAHWLDQGSVAFYETSVDRQLWQPPIAEYFVTVFQGSLGGRDSLANVPQWLAAVALVFATGLMARALGAPRAGQILAAFVVAMSPSFILQSNSSQNDLLCSLWVSMVAYWALVQWTRPSGGHSRLLGFGLALGLALGSKGTAWPVVLPWVGAFLIAEWRAVGPRRYPVRALILIVLVVGLNAGHWSRNVAGFGNPLGPGSVQRMLRPESLAPVAIASNGLANLSLHFGTPWVPVNIGLERGFSLVHAAAGADLSGLYPYFGGYRIMPWSTHEDRAGSPWHITLAWAGVGFVVAYWRRLRSGPRCAIVCFAGSWLMFILLVRWQPFNSRLQLPLIALSAPLIAILLRRWPRPLMFGSMILMLVWAAPALVSNQLRPLVGLAGSSPAVGPRPSILGQARSAAYFNARPDLADVYPRLLAEAGRRGCRDIGLVAGYDSWEYPLWALSREAGVRFTHLTDGGEAESNHCAVIGLDQGSRWPGPRGYEPAWQRQRYSVWLAPEQNGGGRRP